MSVESVTEIIGSGGDVTKKETSFTRQYLVKMRSATAYDSDLAVNATGIPAINAKWPNNISGRATPTVRSKSAKLWDNNSRLHWLVEVKYSNERTNDEKENAADPDTEPWNLDPVYSSDHVEYQESADVEYSGSAIVNSAGDMFDPVPQYSRGNTKITVSRNTLAFSESTAKALRLTVNAAAFTLHGVQYDAGLVKLLRWTSSTNTWTDSNGADISYYSETLEFEISRYTWGHELKILDRGYRARPGVGEDPVRVLDANGNPVPEPVLLASDGTQLAEGADPNFIYAQVYEPANWNALGSL